MLVTTEFPVLNLLERGVQIDLQANRSGVSSDHLKVKAPPRSDGVHCSTLIRQVCVNLGLFGNSGSRFNIDSVIDEEDFPIPMAMGMAWEDWLSRQYPDMHYHIGELHSDGVSMSPDGVTVPSDWDFDLGAGIIDEFKLTYKSARRPIEKQTAWLMQVKAYCRALPTTCARLHVLYVNGDYDYNRPGMPPQYIVYNLQFTQQELDTNWSILLNERDALLESQDETVVHE